MVYVTIRGLRIGVDFTLPALGALLCMSMPLSELMMLLTACVLHEGAHLLAMWYCGCKPSLLRISAAGMQLSAEHLAVFPFPRQAMILLAGAAMNLLAAALLLLCGMRMAALWNLAAAIFNLLPYRAADGGTLLYIWLEERLGTARGDRLDGIWYGMVLLFTAIFVMGLCFLPARTPLLWAMLALLAASEFLR